MKVGRVKDEVWLKDILGSEEENFVFGEKISLVFLFVK